MGQVLTFEQVSTAVIVILICCAALVSIWSAWKVIKEMRKPQELRNERLKQLEKQAEDNKTAITDLKEATRLILKSQTVVIQHLTTGDQQENLAEINEEVQKYLWNHL